MDALEGLLAALGRDPGDDTAWLALADCLAERGDEPRSELMRLQVHLRREMMAEQRAEWEKRLHRLWEAGVMACQPRLEGPFGMGFLLIPPGDFFMGAQEGEAWVDPDELPRHRVSLTRGFYLGRTPITQAQWQALMGDNPSHGIGPDRPVEQVSWDDCQDFCQLLSDRLGRRCRLPSEAEWEYACRAGTTTMYASGDGVEALRQVGWCSYSGEWDACGGTRRVAQLRANAWGLHDMHGNVWEWCHDWFHGRTYQRGEARDPRGPRRGSERVVRGGSWRGGPWFCRSAERRPVAPDVREINVGVRVLAELA